MRSLAIVTSSWLSYNACLIVLFIIGPGRTWLSTVGLNPMIALAST